MDPPPCIQNAMMTKDKKPFTYTPGGIDLSEVRSPRMQRRIERNANLGGVSDVPRPPPPQNVGPLPPSALAAMRPQTQVQVFPGPPPPPPMQKNIPPPPPPPSCPLPTQKITTNENQVLERPDMTKIIPENPMSLLRKTGGPAPRKSFVEQMYEDKAPSPPQRNTEAQSPRYQQTPTQRPAQSYQPPQQYQSPPAPAPQAYQAPPVPVPQSYQAPQQYQPPQQQRQYQPPSPPQAQYQQPQYQQPQQFQERATDSPKPAGYYPPVIERQTPQPRPEPQQKSSNVGSLYIPPINQSQQPPHQQKIVSPPTPPDRQPQAQSPGTPTLKEAPRPWQQRNVQPQQEVPSWARKDDEERAQTTQSPPTAPNMQQRWQHPAQQAPPPQPARQQPNQFSPRPQQNQPQQYPPNSYPVHTEIRSGPYQQHPESEERKPNAVYITQPVVLQHPGPTTPQQQQAQPRQQQPASPSPYQQPQQQQQQRNQNYYQQQSRQAQQHTSVESDVRIIPIQIEGRAQPITPGNERNLNRQLSWGSQPPQSNSFKVIQKFTRTDDDEEDDTPVTQHSARYPQEMTEQVRKMKIDNGHFKQVGNGQPQPYIPPSEQVVPEPKKYMGSNIPSRSFKILQAMTAPPDSSANTNYSEELPYAHPYNPYPYPPYYPPPYWSEYYPPYYPPEQSDSSKSCDKNPMKSGRSTPLPQTYMPPYWPDYYSGFYPQEQSDSSSKLSEKSSRSGRSTPLPTYSPAPAMPPYWNCMPPKVPSSGSIRSQSTPPRSERYRRPQTPKPYQEPPNNMEENLHYPQYPMYPPYYDPYYYGYYYGYPPMMPAYPPYYPPSTDMEEQSGYSSMDEMSNYNGRRSSLKRRNSLENSANSVQALRNHFEVRSKSAAPRITITPTFSQERLNIPLPPDKNEEVEEFQPEAERTPPPREQELCRLKSIKSVPNINVYSQENYETDSDSESDESDEETEDEEDITVPHSNEEIIPHQLSVIYEESERGESRWSYRRSSVASEATTIAEHKSEDEEDLEDFLSAQNVKFKIKLFQECNEQLLVDSINNQTLKIFSNESETKSSVLYQNASEQSRCISPFKVENSHVLTEEYKITVKDEETEYETEGDDEYDVYTVSECVQADEVKPQICKVVEATEEISDVSVESGKESDEDWWGMIEKKDEVGVKETSIINKTECDNDNTKAESVMNKVDVSAVTVKLRKKEKNKNETVKESINQSAESEPQNLVFDNSFFDSLQSSNRSSIYDILKEEEDTEESVSGGTLMRVDSFASRLEEIKRNSGLWGLENMENNSTIQTISEETSEAEVEEQVAETKTVESSVEDDNNHNQNEIEKPSMEICNNEDQTNYNDNDNNDEGEVDFWSQIRSDDDDFKPRNKSFAYREEYTEQYTSNEAKDTDSASSRRSSFSKSHINEKNKIEVMETMQEVYYTSSGNYSQHPQESEDPSDSESEVEHEQKEEDRNRNEKSRSRSLEPQSIKERIEALRKSISKKQKKIQEKDDIEYSVKTKISAIEVPAESRSKTASTKSSVKSFEEYSEEEEVDSGVISDISRHISDNEEFPELRKLTRYERAATHSRLFKLLQDECDEQEDDEVFTKKEDKFNRLSVRQLKENRVSPSRSKLSLPLTKCSENYEETSTPINEKLVDELIQSLLRSKKAQMFRNMPKEKLHAAAVRILQEGIDSSGETPEEFSGILTPLRGDTESSTPAQTPQEFYGDYSEYNQYYDSWSDAATEIVPSRAFKLLQEHLGSSKLGTIEGILAKCPRILSSKNIPKEILKLLDESGSESLSTTSSNLPQSNDVTNT